MRRLLESAAVLLAVLPASEAQALLYYVAPTGDDVFDGGPNDPWLTLQHAADTVRAGDTVIVRAGQYAGMNLTTSGMPGALLRFQAEPGVVIQSPGATLPDGINLEGASFVVIEGFTVTGAARAGIRAVQCRQVVIRNNVADANTRWGILTGFCDDLLIESNQASSSIEEHGIYVGNSGDRPVIRGNRVFNNRVNGIYLNSDLSQGGDGIITGALIERNVIYGNGQGGGSGISCDGVQDSTIQNNLLYDNHASGISLYKINGGGASTGNLVVNNSVLVAADGRWALNIQNASTGNTAYNNILLDLNPSNGSIIISSDSMMGFLSDYNLVVDRFSIQANVVGLSLWRQLLQGDGNSRIAAADQVFVDLLRGDYHLAMASPAIDRGTSTRAPLDDLAGAPRGTVVDIGAYEACPVSGCMVPDAGVSIDAATPVDAATAVDSEPTNPDAGVAMEDAAAMHLPPDAASAVVIPPGDGSVRLDAGGGSTTVNEKGCGCRATDQPARSSPLLVLLVVLGSISRARGRSRRG